MTPREAIIAAYIKGWTMRAWLTNPDYDEATEVARAAEFAAREYADSLEPQAAPPCPYCRDHYHTDTRLETQWVCEHCGERLPIGSEPRAYPVADCEIPLPHEAPGTYTGPTGHYLELRCIYCHKMIDQRRMGDPCPERVKP